MTALFENTNVSQDLADGVRQRGLSHATPVATTTAILKMVTSRSHAQNRWQGNSTMISGAFISEGLGADLAARHLTRAPSLST